MARPESSDSAGSPAASAEASALIFAFSSKVVPVSSGSTKFNSAADFAVKPKGPIRSWISRILPALWLATTMVLVSSLRMIVLFDAPDTGFSAFKAVARWIAEIDRSAALRPGDFGFDGDTLGHQPGGNRIEIFARDAETGVSRTASAMRRHLQRGR